MHYTCLIIERDADAASRLQREFPSFGFKPHTVDSCQSAMTLLQQWNFDAVLLDADSFGEHYIAALRRLRRLRRGSRSPVVLLVRAHDEAAQLAGLESGASDVVLLPASTRLLAAKLRRLIEASAGPDDEEPSELSVGPLLMNARHGSASVGDKPLVLTAHQFDLLYLLALKIGQYVHRETITRVLRSAAADTGRAVDVHVYRIRKSLRAAGATSLRLDTIHGRGYCLSLDTSAAAEAFDDFDDHAAGMLQPTA
ncbi:MAG: response regulator transcription factor [Burkholderiales bacterium]